MIDLDYAVYSFVALFLIVDSITNIPAFHSLLEMYSTGDGSQMIGRSVIIAGGGSASWDPATLAAADVGGDDRVTSQSYRR